MTPADMAAAQAGVAEAIATGRLRVPGAPVPSDVPPFIDRTIGAAMLNGIRVHQVERSAACCCTDGRHDPLDRDAPGGDLRHAQEYAAAMTERTGRQWHAIASRHVELDTPWETS